MQVFCAVGHLRWAAIASHCGWVSEAMLWPFGRYWRMRPLVFSFVPCSQLWCGVAKQNFTGLTASICRYQWNSVPLSAVIVAMRRMACQEREQGAVRFGGGPGTELRNQHVAALALDQREDAVTTLSEALPNHRVDLPVTNPPASLDRGGALANHPLSSGESPSAVIAPRALPALLAGTP